MSRAVSFGSLAGALLVDDEVFVAVDREVAEMWDEDPEVISHQV